MTKHKRKAPELPTRVAYTELQQAFDFFNRELFNGELPPCILTVQRKSKTHGYLSARRWDHVDGHFIDELAVNPEFFRDWPVIDVLATIVHEQCHLWQVHFGKPSRAGYHNKEWAAKMRSVGLIPSDTGKPGGKETGQRMNDYPEPDGRFEKAAEKLLKRGFQFTYADRARLFRQAAEAKPPDAESDAEEAPPKAKRPSKLKYTCGGCGVNVWGKPDLDIRCGPCDARLVVAT